MIYQRRRRLDKRVVSVPGKVFLAGEHAVVYGTPAVVAAVGLRCKVKFKRLEKKGMVIKDKYKDLRLARFAVEACRREMKTSLRGGILEINSELPVGGHLGSSAAMGTAIVWALMKGYPERQKNKVVKLIEDEQHGNSSGVDQTIVREGGVISYQRGVGFRVLKKIVWPEFLLIDSGKPVESTGEMVAKMAERWRGAKKKYEGLFEKIGKISEGWEKEFDPGELIKKNQRLLEMLGVVGEKAKAMVREIEKRGGAAKICGGGGVKKGSGILLAWLGKIDRLKQWAGKQGWKYYQVKLGVEGVRYEKD